MRSVIIFLTLGSFHLFSFAQQFQLESTVDNRNIDAIFDIDGDGIMEYIADTNKVYDGLTHNLKYTLPIGYHLYFGDKIEANNPYLVFPHIDFNSDGKRDLMIYSYGQDQTFIILDLVNNTILFEFNPQEDYVTFNDLIDIDGDNELELVITGESGTWPNIIYKTYIFSTGLTTLVLEENKIASPKEYRLEQNYPNPFNPATTIRYSLSGAENISIKIYDVSGQLVNEINKEHNQAGEYEVIWDGKNNFGQKISSGTYLYQLIVGNYAEAKKMILIK